MWRFAAGNGYDMLDIHYELIDLFEQSAANGERVLDVTGADVAAFCDGLLQNTQTYTAKWRADLNRSVTKGVKKHADE
jgi:DNA-binding ferritin-like protein (Dps family)